MHQIAGRLRVNEEYDNVFKHLILHIFSPNKGAKTDEQFYKSLAWNKKEVEKIIKSYTLLTDDLKPSYVERMCIDDLVCSYEKESDTYVYNDDKAKYMEHNHRLVNKVYKDGLSVRGSYRKEGFEDPKIRYRDDSNIILDKVSTDSYENLLRQYIALVEQQADESLRKRYEVEYPEFRAAFELLGKKGIETCKYREKKIKARMLALSNETLEIVHRSFFKEVGNNEFIRKNEAKILLRKIYAGINLKAYNPTASILKTCRWYDVKYEKRTIDGKRVEGLVLIKSTDPDSITYAINQFTNSIF
jgi:hypothetical protein